MTIHKLTPAYGFLLSTNSEVLRFLKLVLSEEEYDYAKNAFKVKPKSNFESYVDDENAEFFYGLSSPNTTKKIPGLTWCYLTHDLEKRIKKYEKTKKDNLFFVGFEIKNQLEEKPSDYGYSTCMLLKFEEVCKARDNTVNFATEHKFELCSSDIYFLQDDCKCCS